MTQSTALSQTISGVDKAAVFLLGIGDQVGADLLRQMEPDEIRRVTSAISALDCVAPVHMLTVFREFEDLTATSRFFAKGGAGSARRLVEQALGPQSAQSLLDPLPLEMTKESPEAGVFRNTDPQQLAVFLRGENPQIIAMVLSNIPSEQAGSIMSALPAELQPQVALRMASLDRISPEVFRRIAEVIGTKLKGVPQVSKSDGATSLAALLNKIDPALAESILSRVDAENETIGSSVRNLMFVFEDILSIDNEGMKVVVAKGDRRIITTALKGASIKLRGHFTKCMSQRAAEMLNEDMEALGPIRIRDVEAAQQQLVSLVRQLQQDGSISVNRGGAADEYVV